MNTQAPDLQALIELSEKATAGEWLHATDIGQVGSVESNGSVVAVTQQQIGDTDRIQRDANAAFIAALVNWFRANHSTLTAPTLPGAGGGDGRIDTTKLVLPPRRYTSHAGMVGTTAADEIWNEAIDACNAAIDAALPPQQGG